MKKFPDEGFLYILDNHEQLYGFPVLKHEEDGIHDVSIPVCNFILMSTSFAPTQYVTRKNAIKSLDLKEIYTTFLHDFTNIVVFFLPQAKSLFYSIQKEVFFSFQIIETLRQRYEQLSVVVAFLEYVPFRESNRKITSSRSSFTP